VRKAPLKRRRQPRGYKEPGRLAFRIQVLSGAECIMAGHSRERCGGILDPHHVIAKQALRKHGLTSELWNATTESRSAGVTMSATKPRWNEYRARCFLLGRSSSQKNLAWSTCSTATTEAA